MAKHLKLAIALLICNAFLIKVKAQPFTPVQIAGFYNDIIAETGTSSLTTTTSRVDGPSSNKIIYTQAFRTSNSFGGGGIPDNGTITDAFGTYQLAPYNALNAFIIPRNTNNDVNIVTPDKFSNLRILVLSTEGTSLVNVTLFFNDGTQSVAITNASVTDWFNGNTNVVLQGFGRCTRATPASGADAFTTNPRMYYIDIPVSCANRVKNLQKINIANVTTAGTNAPFPNTVVFALSGKKHTAIAATTTVTNATCAALGSASINFTAGVTPLTIAWNSVPAQSGNNAINLPVGNYTATVTDGGGCTATYAANIALTNNLTISNRSDTSICFGASFTPNFVSNGASYSWTPTNGVSNATILNPVLNPPTTTTYTITCNLGTNCTSTKTFTVTVLQAVQVNAGNDVSIFTGTSTQLQPTAPNGTYLWTPSTGLSSPNILNPIAAPTTTTIYTLRVITPQGCTNTDDVVVNMIPYCVNAMNSFTPNGDGINDNWMVIKGVNCTKNIRVNVYNRYGALMYNNENYQNNWNGTYKGKAVADGTYYYTLEITLLNDAKVLAKGDVTILR